MSDDTKPRARRLGIPFDGTTGPLNAIADVQGVCVGHRTEIANQITNTGVTAILPLGNDGKNGIGSGIDTFVLGDWFPLNGCGEMTGTTWIDESGFVEGPIMLTNTASVGTVRDAVISYSIRQQLRSGQSEQAIDPDTEFSLLLPIIAETYDGWLNDILGFHVSATMVNNAIDGAQSTNVDEGNVGGGAGMTCYDWKGGIGTSSRVVDIFGTKPNGAPVKIGTHTVGVLVQANQGKYWDLMIRGVPVGRDKDFKNPPQSPDQPPGSRSRRGRKSSIIVVIAPHQLKRMARRAALGIARTGTITNIDSGEISIAFSTANPDATVGDKPAPMVMIPNDSMDPLLGAVVEATEEATINALVGAQTLTGRGGMHTATAITDMTHPSLVDIMKKYNRWVQPAR